jgi:C4-dicarboxylate-specific signal transduction histidine kinase
VRDLSGTLQAANRAEGGACFTVDLPLASPQE